MSLPMIGGLMLAAALYAIGVRRLARRQIHWSPATGAHSTSGAVKATWGATGWERGKLGYPTSDYTCGLKDGGCFQHFQGGDIHWSSATGAWCRPARTTRSASCPWTSSSTRSAGRRRPIDRRGATYGGPPAARNG